MINGKTVSLVMVVYNSSHLAKRAIDSVRSIVDEIVIVDQGSNDEHSKNFKELATLYISTTNKGNADFDRNFSYSLASKEYILALDSDEYLEQTEIEKLKKLINKYQFDVCWFMFHNTMESNAIKVDLADILGDDPHPRFWRKVVGVNGQLMPTLDWPIQAHQFPRMGSQNQVFSNIKFEHNRQLEDVLRTHINRGKNIHPEAQVQEREFVKRVLDKFGVEVKESIKIKIPEISAYLKGTANG